MVILTNPNEQPARAVGERARVGTRNHHNWGARFGRQREAQRAEPIGLLRLEILADRSVQLMEKYGQKSKYNYQKAMDLLRLRYNLNFIVLCENCGGPHINDELVAPER